MMATRGEKARDFVKRLGITVLPLFIFFTAGTLHAFVLGETYDADNWREIEGMVVPPMKGWLKEGEFTVPTHPLDFEWRITDQDFESASMKNRGKYDMDQDGYIVEKNTGKSPESIFGIPFPVIDPEDPKAGEKLAENMAYVRYRGSAFAYSTAVHWVGAGGFERTIMATGNFLYYLGRRGGALPNPSKFLQQQFFMSVEPFDLRGFVQLIWDYQGEKTSSAFVYDPRIRRLCRVTPVTLSNPFLGCDMCVDDFNLWCGKNQRMTWKLVEDATVLAAFTNWLTIEITQNQDGSINREFPILEMGCKREGWTGAPWAPVNVFWHPQDVWVLEATPKEEGYAYGRMLYYVDKNAFNVWFKVIFNNKDEYWKTMLASCSFQVTPTGESITSIGADGYVSIDDKNHHATYVQFIKYSGREYRIYLPKDVLGPDHFTTSSIVEMTK